MVEENRPLGYNYTGNLFPYEGGFNDKKDKQIGS